MPENPTRPLLRYHGGKWVLAPWIISHFPPHKTYVEPFGGAASVLLRKPRSHAEIYNDKDGAIVNLFCVLRDPEQTEQLIHAMRFTPYSAEEFGKAQEGKTAGWEGMPAVDRARALLICAGMGYGNGGGTGIWKTGFRRWGRGSGSHPSRDWRGVPTILETVADRLQGVVIECRDALEVIHTHDYEDTLFYVDPPYVQETRGRWANGGYRYELSDDDHRELASHLHVCNGFVVLSGYNCELYRDLYGDWKRIGRQHYADGAHLRTESIWLNPRAAEFMPQGRLAL